MKKSKPNSTVKIVVVAVVTVLMAFLTVVTALVLFFSFSMPIGGAEDTDGDGRVDRFWDGESEKKSNFERWFKQ